MLFFYVTDHLLLWFPDTDGQPFVEEVVVESVLHVRSPSSRQARTNTQTSLQDGARVAEAKIYH